MSECVRTCVNCENKALHSVDYSDPQNSISIFFILSNEEQHDPEKIYRHPPTSLQHSKLQLATTCSLHARCVDVNDVRRWVGSHELSW